MVEVLPSGNIVVDSGDARFETINDVLPDVEIGADYRMPKIFGKDSTLAQILIYGQPLSVENQINSATNSENDNEIVAEQLRNMGIYIN